MNLKFKDSVNKLSENNLITSEEKDFLLKKEAGGLIDKEKINRLNALINSLYGAVNQVVNPGLVIDAQEEEFTELIIAIKKEINLMIWAY